MHYILNKRGYDMFVHMKLGINKLILLVHIDKQ